jgi:hypothetical protein
MAEQEDRTVDDSKSPMKIIVSTTESAACGGGYRHPPPASSWCPFTGSVELGVFRLAELGRFVAACPI